MATKVHNTILKAIIEEETRKLIIILFSEKTNRNQHYIKKPKNKKHKIYLPEKHGRLLRKQDLFATTNNRQENCSSYLTRSISKPKDDIVW